MRSIFYFCNVGGEEVGETFGEHGEATNGKLFNAAHAAVDIGSFRRIRKY